MFKMVGISNSDLSSTIWDIMKAGDLNTLTAKKIRALCEQKFKVDLTDRKSEIDDIVVAFVKKYCDDARAGKEAKVEKPVENVKAIKAVKEKKSDEEIAASSDSSSDSGSNSGSECSNSESSDVESDQASSQTQMKQKSLPPKKVLAKNNVSVAAKKKKVQPDKTAPAPKKFKKNEALEKPENVSAKNNVSVAAKKKKVQPTGPKKQNLDRPLVLNDADLARQIHAQDFGLRRATVERGFRSTSRKVKKTEATKKKKKASPKKCVLSSVLAEVIGETEMSREDVVKKMWHIVKERNLFDESNRQFALCDEQLKKLFGKKRIRLFGMMKYLKHHIKDIQDIQ